MGITLYRPVIINNSKRGTSNSEANNIILINKIFYKLILTSFSHGSRNTSRLVTDVYLD